MGDILMIGIAGGSGSGKTTLATTGETISAIRLPWCITIIIIIPTMI